MMNRPVAAFFLLVLRAAHGIVEIDARGSDPVVSRILTPTALEQWTTEYPSVAYDQTTGEFTLTFLHGIGDDKSLVPPTPRIEAFSECQGTHDVPPDVGSNLVQDGSLYLTTVEAKYTHPTGDGITYQTSWTFVMDRIQDSPAYYPNGLHATAEICFRVGIANAQQIGCPMVNFRELIYRVNYNFVTGFSTGGYMAAEETATSGIREVLANPCTGDATTPFVQGEEICLKFCPRRTGGVSTEWVQNLTLATTYTQGAKVVNGEAILNDAYCWCDDTCCNVVFTLDESFYTVSIADVAAGATPQIVDASGSVILSWTSSSSRGRELRGGKERVMKEGTIVQFNTQFQVVGNSFGSSSFSSAGFSTAFATVVSVLSTTVFVAHWFF